MHHQMGYFLNSMSFTKLYSLRPMPQCLQTTSCRFQFFNYHLFGLGDLKDVADVDSGVDWNWPWPWQIVHPRAVALIDTFQLLVVF